MSFPVLEESNALQGYQTFGYLENVVIRVLKAHKEDRFVLIPAAE